MTELMQAIYRPAAKLKVANGKWELAPKAAKQEWNGTCGKCGAVVPAVDLKLTVLPFGRGERWQCREC